jgi:uncharacterized membrane protein YphA (DoxX/SURF4 family)
VRILQAGLGILAGLFILMTGVLKLRDTDQYDLYVYSFQWANFYFVTVFTRVLIAAELILGLFLITGLHYKRAAYCTLAVMVLHLLCYFVQLTKGSQSFIHDPETWNTMSPALAIAFIVMLVQSLGRPSLRFKGTRLVTILAIISLSILPIIISPPDVIYHRIYPLTHENPIPKTITLSDTSLSNKEGVTVLLFASPGCHYCQLAAIKLSIMMHRNELRQNASICFMGDEESVALFWQETGIEPMPYIILEPEEIIPITEGSFPTLFFLQEGRVIHRSGYRDFADHHLNI